MVLSLLDYSINLSFFRYNMTVVSDIYYSSQTPYPPRTSPMKLS